MAKKKPGFFGRIKNWLGQQESGTSEDSKQEPKKPNPVITKPKEIKPKFVKPEKTIEPPPTKTEPKISEPETKAPEIQIKKEPELEEPEPEKITVPEPEAWGDLSMQSPINLFSDEADKKDSDLSFEYDYVSLRVEQAKYSINFVPTSGTNAILIGEKRYRFVQFHLHTPSEHSINGTLFTAELHLVHQNEAGQYAVVGIVLDGFNFSDMTAGAYSAMTNAIIQRKKSSEPIEISIDLNHTLCKELDFFRYQGSLTTPPYTQDVAWFVGKRFLPQDILCELELAMAEKNNREIQDIEGRKIFFGRAKTKN